MIFPLKKIYILDIRYWLYFNIYVCFFFGYGGCKKKKKMLVKYI